MLRPKSILPILLAFWVAITSLGVVITSHHCKVSGREDVSLGALKACCAGHDAEGFRPEPCCTVKIQKIKLPSFRLAEPIIEVPVYQVFVLPKLPALVNLESSAEIASHFIEKDDPPIISGRDYLRLNCQMLI